MQEIRTEIKCYNTSRCLSCGHQDKVYHPSKEKYQEITICPKCNGAFVDMFKLGKYKQHINQYKECNHKYQVLDSETTFFYSEGKRFINKITASFYCEKCLDIKHKEVECHVGNNSERV